MSSQKAGPASERTTVRRRAQRGVYDRDTINAILDEALICHVGVVVDSQPYVLPTIHARAGDRLFLHGAATNRMLTAARGGIPLCVTVTLLDGLVLARSAFHHSMNYRSVVVLGAATEIVEHDAKREAMRALVEHVVPGRWNDTRPPSDAELQATQILMLPIAEASAKVRVGPPIDDEEDYPLKWWAGEIPLGLAVHAPIADPRLTAGIEVPAYVARYRRPAPTAADSAVDQRAARA
jgi:nitroimidazol reductase NimA-like FMN-containing flavoprotein (pyridoxamine 5'-phosphate oxidase superfamily)